MSANIDPQRVLKLINSMGYKNVSANELKDFTKGKINQWTVNSFFYSFEFVFVDLKKLVKYEQNSKEKPKITSKKHHPHVRHAPENIINVMIVKESSPQKIVDQAPTTKSKSIDPSAENSVQKSQKTEQPEVSTETKHSKRLLRLPKHIKTRNPKIVYKKGVGFVSDKRNGLLIRNTPIDLYQKYQEDWLKFKAFIPGESDRTQLRRSIRRKMQQRNDDDDAKVSFLFLVNTGKMVVLHANLMFA